MVVWRCWKVLYKCSPFSNKTIIMWGVSEIVQRTEKRRQETNILTSFRRILLVSFEGPQQSPPCFRNVTSVTITIFVGWVNYFNVQFKKQNLNSDWKANERKACLKWLSTIVCFSLHCKVNTVFSQNITHSFAKTVCLIYFFMNLFFYRCLFYFVFCCAI